MRNNLHIPSRASLYRNIEKVYDEACPFLVPVEVAEAQAQAAL